MRYKTTSFSQAQSSWDHMEPPYGAEQYREDRAAEIIYEAMSGEDEQAQKMLTLLGVSMDEYLEEYCGIPESLADACANEHIRIMQSKDNNYYGD